jgi:flagellar protein FlaG
MNINPISSSAQHSAAASAQAHAAKTAQTSPAAVQVAKDAAAKPETAAAKVKLQAPEKVDLGFNPQEMRENIQEAIDRLNQQLKANGRDLSFQMDEEINRPIITVRNIETGEVVRQIPSEEIIRMAHSIEEGKGLLFNESL